MDPWYQSILSLYPLNSPYLLACSGGMDSVLLFHLLRELPPPNLLHVCHLDHRMRPESAQDACFVSELCQKYSIPFILEEATPPPRSEEEARNRRRDFFLRVAKQTHSRSIFLAHHQDDQLETILHRMIRGAGLASLRGMSPRSLLDQDIWLLRPFLSRSRQEIQAEIQKRQLSYREDPSNQDSRYFRNRLRHELLPLLRNLHPTVDDSLIRLARQAEQLPDAVDMGDLRFQTLESLSPYLRSISLKKYLETETGHMIQFVHIEQILQCWIHGQNGAEIALPGGKKIIRAYDRFILESIQTEAPCAEILISLEPGQQKTSDYEMSWGPEAKTSPLSHFDYILIFQPTAVSFPLKVRARKSGDRIRSRGFAGKSHLVKKLLIDSHLPQIYRERFPILVDANEEILWVPGIRMAEKIQGSGFVLYLKLTSFFSSNEFHIECPTR